MPTTTELFHTLADPNPPAPDADARAGVALRSATLVRRRRRAQGVGVLACVAVLAVGVVAVTNASPASHGTVESAVEPPPGTPEAGARLSVLADDVVPAGVELDVVLSGAPGTYRAHVRTPGAIELDAVAPGDYTLQWSWASDDGTAAATGHVAVHVDRSALTVTLSSADPPTS